MSILLVPTTGRAAIIEDDVISWWSCEETDGVRYDENTTNSNDLTDNNTVTQGTGKVGYACDLERGTSEYLSITDANQTGLDGGEDYTWTIWAKFDQDLGTNDKYPLINKMDASGNRAYQMLIIHNGTADQYQFDYSTACNATISWLLTDTQPTLTDWNMYTFTFDNTNATRKVYENGTLVNTQTGTTGTICNSNSDVKIGNNPWEEFYTDGLYDEIAVFNRVLTADEISSLYNSGTGVSFETLFNPTSTTSTSTATTTTTSVDVEELKWVLELYLSIFMFLIFTYVGYRFTKLFI